MLTLMLSQKQRCPLQGILAYPEAVSQKNRFMTLGWHAAICIDMNQAYDACLTPDERKRYATTASLASIDMSSV